MIVYVTKRLLLAQLPKRDPDAPSMCSLQSLGPRLPKDGECTILFGAERTGLLVDEVERCQELVRSQRRSVFHR